MLSDLTLEICVPSLRWIEAHLMQRKIPNYFILAWIRKGRRIKGPEGIEGKRLIVD